MQFLQTRKCGKIHNKLVFIIHICQQRFYFYIYLILYKSSSWKSFFTFHITQPLRIWKSGPLIYQLTHSICNLKNIKLSVQTYIYIYMHNRCVYLWIITKFCNVKSRYKSVFGSSGYVEFVNWQGSIAVNTIIYSKIEATCARLLWQLSRGNTFKL